MAGEPRRRSTGERIFVAAIGLVFAIQFGISTGYPSDPRLFPMIIAVVGILLALAMEFGVALGETSSEPLVVMRRHRATLAFLAPPLYGFCLWALGFWISTPIAIPTVAYLLGYRRLPILLAVTAGIVLVIGIVFPLINIAVPSGALLERLRSS